MAMKFEEVRVTPEMASAWMEKNASFQRKVRRNIVDRYVRDIVSGNWEMTHIGIAFDCKGRLIDGQHRLLAIIEAGIGVKTVVVRDVPSSAFDHIDLGFGRLTSDVFKAQGDGWITNEHVAIARLMEFGVSHELLLNRSPFELKSIVEAHINALEFIFQNIERKVRGVTTAPALAAVGVAYYSEMDRVKLAGFLRLLVSGVAHDPVRDGLVIRLRDWLRDSIGIASMMARNEAFLKTQRVVKAYMNDEKLTKLYTPSESVYPVKRRVIKPQD